MLEKKKKHNELETHLSYTEKNYVRMQRILRALHTLCTLISLCKKQKNNPEVVQKIWFFCRNKALPTSLIPEKIEGHFITELAIERGGKSLNRQLVFCADLIKKNPNFKQFKTELRGALDEDVFHSGCIKAGIERQYSLAEKKEQTRHQEINLQTFWGMQTALQRVDFFKETVESKMAWAQCRARVLNDFPGVIDSCAKGKTFALKKGLSVEERAHSGTTILTAKTIASIDHRLQSMILTVIEKQYPQWRMR